MIHEITFKEDDVLYIIAETSSGRKITVNFPDDKDIIKLQIIMKENNFNIGELICR